MSAFLKSATILSGLAATGAAVAYSRSRQQHDFSQSALNVAELAVMDNTKIVKSRLPSEFFSFTVRDYKFSNAS